MGIGALAVVEEWSEAVNRRDVHRLLQLSSETVEVAGPRGAVRGRHVLAGWLGRAGFSSRPRRWFCGADGSVVVEQEARWVNPATGEEVGQALVAARFRVAGGVVAGYQRHGELAEVLAAAGLDEESATRAAETGAPAPWPQQVVRRQGVVAPVSHDGGPDARAGRVRGSLVVGSSS